jgi:hypothetical protein
MKTLFERERKLSLHFWLMASFIAFLLGDLAPSVAFAQSDPLPSSIDLETVPPGTTLSILTTLDADAYPENYTDFSFFDKNVDATAGVVLRRPNPDSRRLAFGDFDADGYDDILIGLPSFLSKRFFRSVIGRAYIIWGDPLINLQIASVISSDLNVTHLLTQEIADAHAGYAVDSGDFDGDGYDDAIISAFSVGGPSSEEGAGGIYIVYGSHQLRTNCVDLEFVDNSKLFPIFTCLDSEGAPLPPYPDITLVWGKTYADRLGQALAVGDIDADGLDDIVVSSISGEDPDPLGFYPDACAPVRGGIVYIIYGTTERSPSLSLDVSLQENLITECVDENGKGVTSFGETRIQGALPNDLLGSSLAVGDINGDGYADIVAGAPRTGVPSSDNRNGEIFVFYGSPSLRNTVIDLADAEEGAFGETRIQDGSIDQDAALGGAVAAGDVNGDGYDDILIGAPEALELDGLPAGAVHVVFGGPNKPGISTGNGGSLVQLLSPFDPNGDVETNGFVEFVGNNLPELNNEVENDRIGQAVGVGDLDGDGIDDILLGGPGDNPANEGNRADGGNSYVVLGARGALDSPGAFSDAPQRLTCNGIVTNPADPLFPFCNEGVEGNEEGDGLVAADHKILFHQPGDFFGLGSVGNADLDRDGFAEIAALAPGRNEEFLGSDTSIPGQVSSAVVIFGGGNSPTASKTRFSINGDAPPIDFGPVLRAQIDWAGGTGINIDEDNNFESEFATPFTKLTLLRQPPFEGVLVENEGLVQIGDSVWRLITNRYANLSTNGTPLAKVKLEYLDNEFNALQLNEENNFKIAINYFGTNTPGFIVPSEVDVERNHITTSDYIFIPGDFFFTDDEASVQFAIVADPTANEPPKLPVECDADLVESVGDVPCGGRRIRGPLPNAQLGAGSGPVAFGDFNNDGFQDILAGAPFYNTGGSFMGAAFIVYGAAGAPADLDLSGSPSAGGFTLIRGANASDMTGHSVAAVDMDSDGFDDAILGAPGANPAGRESAGIVYIIYGRANLPGATIDLAAAPTSNGETRIYGDDLFDQAGWAVDAASLNNDRAGDLVIGAPGADPLGRSNAGEAYLISGSLIDRATILDLSLGSDSASAFGETRILGAFGAPVGAHEPGGAQAGLSVVSCGDINGDGFVDAVIGAPTSTSGFIGFGFASVVYGSSAALAGAIVDLADLGAASLPIPPTMIAGESLLSFYGQSLAVGDVNGDGFADVIAGAPEQSARTFSREGAVYILPGSQDLPGQDIFLFDELERVWKIQGASNGDALGSAVAAGDVDGDGLDDIIAGALGLDVILDGGASLEDAGGAFVFYGSRLLGRPLGTRIDLAAQPADAELLGTGAHEFFGFSAKSGADLNGDGFEDFVLGAPFANTLSGGSQSGALLAAYGRGLNLPVPVAMPAPDDDAEPIDFGPTVRASVDFEDGEGGLTLITRIPGAEALVSGLPEQRQPIGSVWEFRTTRARYKPNGKKKESKGRVEFRYLEEEFGNFKENKLKLHRAESLSGPWHGAGNVQLDTAHNTISGKLHKPDDAPVYYVITGKEKNN